ncbi:hypothetical protein CVT24_009952 [Panaeolus cyanescens]|uniref:Uncharacterized protein n=1 Tax=Panaeolus cyanescens TaxID=181874 RepID=A0A409W415_9AGAR|nr:hypothetical protein CVT24_009952 [Panaeolus cyanescens]
MTPILEPCPVWGTSRSQPGLELNAASVPLSRRPEFASWTPDSTDTIDVSLSSSPDTLVNDEPITGPMSRLLKLKDLLESAKRTSKARCLSPIATKECVPVATDLGHIETKDHDVKESAKTFLNPPSPQLALNTLPTPASVSRAFAALLLELAEEVKNEDAPDWKEVPTFSPEKRLFKPKLNPSASVFIPALSRRGSEVTYASSRRSSISTQHWSTNSDYSDIEPPQSAVNLPIGPSRSLNWKSDTSEQATTSASDTWIRSSSHIIETALVEQEQGNEMSVPFQFDVNANAQKSGSHLVERFEIPLFPPGLRPPNLLRHPLWPAQDVGFCPTPFLDRAKGQEYLPPLYLDLLETHINPTTPSSQLEEAAQKIIDALNYSCNFSAAPQDVFALVQALVTASTRVSTHVKEESYTPHDTPLASNVDTSKQASIEDQMECRFGELTSFILGAMVRTPALGEKVAVDFGWRLCDALVHEFHRHWGPNSTDHSDCQQPTSSEVGFDICRCIASLSRYGVLPQEHIRVCLKILLNDKASINLARVEALGCLIEGVGVGGFIPREWNKMLDRASSSKLDSSTDLQVLSGMYNHARGEMEWVSTELSACLELHILVKSDMLEQYRLMEKRVKEIHETILSFERCLNAGLTSRFDHYEANVNSTST